MKKVAIIQKSLPHYRIDFLNKLREELKKNEVELKLIYGKPKNDIKKDEVDLDWAILISNKTFEFQNKELIWQPCLPHIEDQDLVIVEQANKLVLNYLLISKRLFSKQKFAYWGHGRNMQANQDGFRNKFKNIFINRCDWWFAYTKGVKKYLSEMGFPSQKITAVQNAINTQSLIKDFESIENEEINELKEKLEITSENVGIYCGGIYEEKRIPFLIEAIDQIKERIPDFVMLVIGAGTDAHLIEKAAQERSWLKYLGPKFGREKVLYFKLSKLFLMPGLVGLAVIDSFALQTPMATTDYPYHSPEIEYLENGVNGVVSGNSVGEYVEAVVEILTDDTKYEKLVNGCLESKSVYTSDKMASNFADGIIQCLAE
ncbi:glycosyltransferase family 4 protein [Flexithrix dorotheae]|uniref:glycosyltransferase family 4 protein n=1 Tax=Flexithrix dorotheae TaxID=70993 RepID=UPI000373F9A7|nr:glycosyltransferase family 4 protein [Flexithrix dorotheae]